MEGCFGTGSRSTRIEAVKVWSRVRRYRERRVYEWSSAAGNASRKKFLALPASKKFHINHTSQHPRVAFKRERDGGTGRNYSTLLNSVCVRAVPRNYVPLPPNATTYSPVRLFH